MPDQIQVLKKRYVDGAALLKLLNERFGNGKYTVDVCK